MFKMQCGMKEREEVFRIIPLSVLLSLKINLKSSSISFQVFVYSVIWGICKVDLLACVELKQDVA